MPLYAAIHKHIIDKLTKGLSPALSYHNVAHTVDVLKQAEAIAANEGINNGSDLNLLKISALYHDVGFLEIYTGHEEVSCAIASKELSEFGFTEEQIDKVCSMIRATKVPQQPNTKLEQILCDSDLDYLGRDDFFSIGEGLYNEFLDQQIVSNEREWNILQVKFLENHHYFTATSKRLRESMKQQNLEAVKKKII